MVKILTEEGLDENILLDKELDLFCPKGHHWIYNSHSTICPICHIPFNSNSLTVKDIKVKNNKDFNIIFIYTEDKAIEIKTRQNIIINKGDNISINSLIGINKFFNLINHTKSISWELEQYEILDKSQFSNFYLKFHYIYLIKRLEIIISFFIPFIVSIILFNNFLSLNYTIFISIIIALIIQNFVLLNNQQPNYFSELKDNLE